ncbi:MAG: hypothetical protein ACXVVK_00535 [Solirubrobacteraceae bacterium]
MHRSRKHSARWLAATAGVLALAAFPAAAWAAPPVNTVPPTITIPAGGASNEITNPSEGRILTSTPGTWNPPQTTYHYQWTQDCAPSAVPASPGTPITGATNSTYQIAHSDIGHTLCLTVNTGGSATVISSNQTGVVTAGTPIDRAAPTMAGMTTDGRTLTADPGRWDGTAPISFTYAWRRCDSAGKNCGAVFTAFSTSPTYVLQNADVGHTMSVVVTAANPATQPTTTTPPVQLGSFATNSVVTPGNTGAPTISGTAQQGQTLTESHGSWLPSTSTLTSQWESCDSSGAGCSPIPGATGQTYKLTSADVGHTVVVQETASQNGASSSPAASAPTGVVQAAPTSGGPGGGGNPGGGNPSGGGSASGGQPTPAGNAPSPVGVDVAHLRGLLGNALGVHGRTARIRALLLRGGYSVIFSAPSAGRLSIAWYQVQHGRRVLVATVNVLLHRAGNAKVELVLTRRGRTLLKRAARLNLTAQGGFTPVGQGTTSASRRITLIR